MINKLQKKADCEFGRNNEIEVFEILKLRHGENVKQYTEKYSTFDFYVVDDNDNIIQEYELKGRRCSIKTYPTLCFGTNKIDYADKQHNINIKTTFLWLLKEGLFEWDYTNKSFENKNYYLDTICNKARNDKPHDAVFVKTQFIKPFKNLQYVMWN